MAPHYKTINKFHKPPFTHVSAAARCTGSAMAIRALCESRSRDTNDANNRTATTMTLAPKLLFDMYTKKNRSSIFHNRLTTAAEEEQGYERCAPGKRAKLGLLSSHVRLFLQYPWFLLVVDWCIFWLPIKYPNCRIFCAFFFRILALISGCVRYSCVSGIALCACEFRRV